MKLSPRTVRNGGACVLAACFLVGCATEVANHTFIGAPRAARPANHPVQVFTNGLPGQPFDRVAILDVHCESQGFMQPNLEQDGLPKLKHEARRAGCDGIIEIEARTPKNWTFETKSVHYSAVGIVFK
jgi:hypothetical protein